MVAHSAYSLEDDRNKGVFLIFALHSGLCRLLSLLSCGHLCIRYNKNFSWKNISPAIGCISDKSVNVPLRMNCNNFGDDLTLQQCAYAHYPQLCISAN